ncbi:MAG: putative Histidine kinase [Verrucomicrobiales bacterium]|nr:putative Histidine kinase [Verrucomicrobiales bacterium]
MSDTEIQLSDDALTRQRRAIFRGLTLINSVNFWAVVLVAVLGFSAVLLALRSNEDAERLWAASVTQARASRFGGEVGWKSNALATISRASEMRPSLALRNEAIAALSTMDLEFVGDWHPSTRDQHQLLFSPDLRSVAVSRFRGGIDLLDAQSARLLRQFEIEAHIETLLFDSNGRYLAALNNKGHLHVWSVETGREIVSARPDWKPGTWTSLAFGKDCVWVGVPESRIQQFSLTTGLKIGELVIGIDARAFVVDRSGEMLVCATGENGEIWNLSSRTRLQKLVCPGGMASLALSSSGRYLAAGSGDTAVYLWDLQRNERKALLGHHGTVFRVAFSNAEDRLASCAFGGTTRIWEIASGRTLLTTENVFIDRFGTEEGLVACSRTEAGFGLGRISDHGILRHIGLDTADEPSIYSCEFISTNLVLLTRPNGAKLVNFRNGEILTTLPGERMRGASLNRAESSIFTTSWEGLRRWPVKEVDQIALTNVQTIPISQGVCNEALQLSHDGTEALARIGFKGAVLVDLKSGRSIASFSVPNIGGLALSRDKEIVVTSTFHGGGTKVWRRNGELIKNIAGRDSGVALSPDGKWLAAVSSDLCSIYDTKRWELRHQLPMESASGLPGAAAFSSDSRILAFTKQRRSIQLAEAETGREIASLTVGNPEQINMLAFSPDNEFLAGSTHEGNLQLWNLPELTANLHRLNLDWKTGAYKRVQRSRSPSTLTWVGTIAVVTLAAVLGFSILAWRRHRQFIGAYGRIERAVEQRNRQLQAAQTEIFQSQKMRALGTLAAGIAHDFNNLLSVIRLSNRLNSEEAGANAEIQENTALIERAVAQGKRVVRSMLGYVRKGAAHESYAVGEIIEQTVGLLRQEFLEKITVTISIKSDLPKVTGMKNILEQILLNLIINAAEAMRGQGRLAIVARQQSNQVSTDFAVRPAAAPMYIEIMIQDSGPGMSHDTISRMFEPFFTTKTVGNDRGTGLGLSMVYAGAREQGIGLACTSSPGEGTTFYLLIPTGVETSNVPTESGAANILA